MDTPRLFEREGREDPKNQGSAGISHGTAFLLVRVREAPLFFLLVRSDYLRFLIRRSTAPDKSVANETEERTVETTMIAEEFAVP